MNQCSNCKQEYNSDGFYKDKRKKNGLTSWCKICIRKLSNSDYYSDKNKKTQWRRDNPERTALIAKRSRLKKKYGLSLEEYQYLLEDQDGCVICGRYKPTVSASGKEKDMPVDHCHNCNMVRGILCFQCNSLLGMAEEDIGVLLEAIKYIFNHNLKCEEE